MVLLISVTVSEAIYALTLNFYTENNITLFSNFANGNGKEYDLTAENSLDLFHFENNLNNWLFDDAAIILNNIFTKFKSNLVNSRDAKNICSQIYYICSRVLIKKDVIPPTTEYLTEIHNASDIFTLENTIQKLMKYTKAFFVGSANSQNKLVENTIKFIHKNLSGLLSLEGIADDLHVSPSHLSRTFKKTCNESLTEYINKARIEKAKVHLIDSDLLTYEIAELVGYNDPAYFSSIFKKYSGLSPTEFKQHYASNSKEEH